MGRNNRRNRRAPATALSFAERMKAAKARKRAELAAALEREERAEQLEREDWAAQAEAAANE